MHKKTIILQSEEFYQRNRMYYGTVKKLTLRKPYFVIKNETIWEKKSGKEYTYSFISDVCICITELLYCTEDSNTTL